MNFSTQALETADTAFAIATISDNVEQDLGGHPDFILVAYSEDHNAAVIQAGLSARFPNTMLLGSSTCRGLLTQDGLMGFGKPVLGIVGFADPDGAYGTAGLDLNGELQATIKDAVEQAQASVNRMGEVPDLVWLHASPGSEEAMISG
ncbi:unnamed protein product, partial [Ectocarpus sp. 12 AP-2014]